VSARKDPNRRERLARALKSNLRKRKEQARARSEEHSPELPDKTGRGEAGD
jgi:hypothetical protein